MKSILNNYRFGIGIGMLIILATAITAIYTNINSFSTGNHDADPVVHGYTMSKEEMKKLLCEKYGKPKYCSGSSTA